jgi:serine/threonine-protein kinase
MSAVADVARLTAALADRYRIERELGRGGMATVFLAEDLRHRRRVAIKVLKPELAAVIGAERFLHEITTTANLQHPHILPLHDSGTVDGTVFYVMPFIEGESLRDRLIREKQLPIAEAVRIATEVAGALDYAHRQGIIHRDIKPENILLHDGRAVVADFGIALAATSAGSRMTETGMSLGTPHYMSPEQAMGARALDARSDVYALGAMIYEMLTGDPPFTGSTAQAIVARVMTERPVPPSRLRDTIPETLEDAVLTALQKLPADRFTNAAEFARALEDARGSGSRPASARLAARSWWRDRRTLALAGVAVLAAAGAWLVRGAGQSEARISESTVLNLNVPRGITPGEISIAPDGRRVVVVGSDSNATRRLYLRELGSANTPALEGTEGARSPFFSPDGRYVAYASRGALWKLELPRGTPEVISGTDRGLIDQGGLISGGAWGPGDSIVINQRFGRLGLWLVSASGGTPVRIAPRDSTDLVVFIGRPRFLSSGGAIIVGARLDAQPAELVTVSLRDGERQKVGVTGTGPVQIASRLTFLRDNRLFTVGFDEGRGQVDGEPVPFEGQDREGLTGTDFDLSAGGTLVLLRQRPDRHWLVQVAPDGRATRLFGEPRDFETPRASPDGRYIATGIRATGGRDIWVLDRAREALTRFTLHGLAAYPTWAPRGERIAYASSIQGGFDISLKPLDGVAAETTVVSGTPFQFPGEWTPDEHWLVFRENNPGTREDIKAIDTRTGEVRELVGSQASELQPALSPDGRLLAYVSDETGTVEVYLRWFDDRPGRTQVSLRGGREPRWARDGRTLYYRDGVSMLAVAISPGDVLAPERPVALFPDRFRANTRVADYDPLPDRTLVMLEPEAEGVPEIQIFLGWPAFQARRAGR